MSRYLVERDVSGWTEEDLDVAGLRAKMCVPWFEGLDWLISYHDPARELLLCVYEARSEDDIRAHARFSGLPVGEVRPVGEIHPENIEGDETAAMDDVKEMSEGPSQPTNAT